MMGSRPCIDIVAVGEIHQLADARPDCVDIIFFLDGTGRPPRPSPSRIPSAPGMLALTRRRDPGARQETWLIYYGYVHVGTKTHPRARRALSAASAGGGVIQPIPGLFVGPTRYGEAIGGRHT